MDIEKAKGLLMSKIKVNNAVIKEARENKDINAIELTADLDSESEAIETVLNELEKKDAVIDLIVTAIISDKKILNLVCNKIINKTDEECEKQNLLCDDCIKQYLYKKAEEK